MGELRNRLDRKSELRLYEWMKNEGNYGKLSDMTVTEGAEAVSRELDLKVSGSVLTSLVQAMGLDPFWKVRNNTGSKRSEAAESIGLADIKKGLEENAAMLEKHGNCIEQLKAVARNMLERIERIEQHRVDRRQHRANNLNGGEEKEAREQQLNRG